MATMVNPQSSTNRNDTDTTQASTRNSKWSKKDKGKGASEQPKKSKIKELWTKSGLDADTLLTMGKGGLPPAIALAMYQATSVAETFTTLGYLVAIISILGFCIMPRAKFIQTMLYNLIAVCVGAAVTLLQLYCVVKARQHTEGPLVAGTNGAPAQGAQAVTYNSSGSVVSAIWLFFQIYLVNSMKAKFPQFTFPVILYSIFVNVASVYGPQFPTMAVSESFVKRLLESFLTGFAIATGVSFVIFPMTSRKVVFKEMICYIGLLRATLKAELKYFQSLEQGDPFSLPEMKDKKKIPGRPEAEAVKACVEGITGLHGKLAGDLPFAKREVAFGKLGPEDIQALFKRLRSIMLPTIGLSSTIDVFQYFSEISGWNKIPREGEPPRVDDETKKGYITDWNDIMTTVHGPFESIVEAMDDGLEHVLLTTGLKKPLKKDKNGKAQSQGTVDDVEAEANSTKPGDPGFAEYLERKSNEFYGGKQLAIREWAERKGIVLAPDFFDNPAVGKYSMPENEEDATRHSRSQRQLYLLLYMEFLLHSTSKAILDMVRFVDERSQSGRLSKTRLIMPGLRRLKKWVMSTFKVEDSTSNEENGMGDLDSSNTITYLGDAYKAKKDPEHLPPANAFEKAGNFVRKIPGFFRSSESAFGFRVACATMSIAIIDFLHQSQTFFIKQRLVWAMIMIAISMTPTAGSSTSGFVLRIGGTVVAMVLAYLAWYIPDEHTAGVIVFVWFFSSCAFYVIIKQPKFIVIGILSIVSLSLIVGYELEVKKIGIAQATSNGQPYYPLYELGPYRLATVSGGLLVAFIWTIFPFPISEHSQMRQMLGGSLYLAANFYSIVHETVQARIRGDEGDMSVKTSPGRRLEKSRTAVYSKLLLMMNGLKMHSAFQKWEAPIGGKFPRERYNTIIQLIENMINYMALVSYASITFNDPNSPSETQWSTDFRRLMSSANLTTHEITSLLALLSNSISGGYPLPPYLKTPAPYQLSRKLEAMDRDILSVRHVAEPGYAAFAVIQIATRCIMDDVERLLKNIRELTGELDFSFHTISTSTRPSTTSTTLLSSGEEREKAD